MSKLRRKKISETLLPGFTLIELLIVIVIIGILAGILLTVIDPSKQQRKARETVLRSTVEKGCLALHACGATTTDATNCDTINEVGIRNSDGTPVGAKYYLRGDTLLTPGSSIASGSGATVGFTGHLTSDAELCTFQCAYDFALSGSGPIMMSKTGTCLIGAQ